MSKAEVLKYIDKHRVMTERDLVRATGLAFDELRPILARLVDDDVLRVRVRKHVDAKKQPIDIYVRAEDEL